MAQLKITARASPNSQKPLVYKRLYSLLVRLLRAGAKARPGNSEDVFPAQRSHQVVRRQCAGVGHRRRRQHALEGIVVRESSGHDLRTACYERQRLYRERVAAAATSEGEKGRGRDKSRNVPNIMTAVSSRGWRVSRKRGV